MRRLHHMKKCSQVEFKPYKEYSHLKIRERQCCLQSQKSNRMQQQEVIPLTGEYLCDRRHQHNAFEYLMVHANNEQVWVAQDLIERHARTFNERHWLGNIELVDMWVATGRRLTFLQYADGRGHYRDEHGHFVFVFYDEEEHVFYEEHEDEE
jgi:hypothetical protein